MDLMIAAVNSKPNIDAQSHKGRPTYKRAGDKFDLYKRAGDKFDLYKRAGDKFDLSKRAGDEFNFQKHT